VIVELVSSSPSHSPIPDCLEQLNPFLMTISNNAAATLQPGE
jgi:hypothetical protein